MNPLAILGAGSSFAPTGGAAGPSSADVGGTSVVLSSPFAVGAGASASASPTTGAGSPMPWLLIAGGAALLAVVLLVRR